MDEHTQQSDKWLVSGKLFHVDTGVFVRLIFNFIWCLNATDC